MPTIKLTKTATERIAAPTKSGKQELYWDADLKGFGLLASGVTTAKTFIVQRMVASKSRRVTVGPANVIGIDKAREKAIGILGDMIAGIDPKEQRRAEQAAAAAATAASITLKDALERYIRERRDLKPRTAEFYRQAVERNLADWLYRPLVEITASMVEQRHGEIAERIQARAKKGKPKAGRISRKGTYAANGTMRSLRAIWNWIAEKDDSLPRNPVRLRRQWFAERSRERVLKPDQFKPWHAAVMTKVSNTTARDYLVTLLFTGLRRRECAALRWEEVDFVNGAIRLSGTRTKADRALDLPISDVVRDLLVARRAVGVEGEFVFAASSESGHVEDVRIALEEIETATGIWISPHDLRRCFVTVASMLPLPALALPALVNHSTGDSVTAGYARVGVAELAAPMQQITDRLKQLCGITPPADVASLGRKAA
jgi:integrase